MCLTMTQHVKLALPSAGSLSSELIVIGFIDACGAGARVVQSIEAAAGARVEHVEVAVEGLGAAQRVFGDDAPSSSGRVILTNVFTPGQTTPQVSALTINAAVAEQQQAHLAAAVAQLVAGVQPRTVLVAAAAVLPGVKQGTDAGALVLPLNGAALPAGLASAAALPAKSQLQDNFLALLTHSLHVTGARTVLALVPGNKLGVLSEVSQGDAAACALAVALSAVLKPTATVDIAKALSLPLAHKWFVAAAQGGGERMYT